MKMCILCFFYFFFIFFLFIYFFFIFFLLHLVFNYFSEGFVPFSRLRTYSFFGLRHYKNTCIVKIYRQLILVFRPDCFETLHVPMACADPGSFV